MATISLQEVKQSLETALLNKPDKTSVYTKGEVNDALSTKADTSNTFTKQEVTNLVNKVKLSHTVSTINAVGGEVELNIPFADYTSSKDVLLVTQQNIHLIKGVNYNISADSKKILFLDYALEAGELIAFEMVRVVVA